MNSGANVVLTSEMLANLDADTIQKIEALVASQKAASPKKRLNTLLEQLEGYLNVSRRTDSDWVEIGSGKLNLSSWYKTAGEQWGNCSESEIYIYELGTKYMTLIRNNSTTNYNNWSKYLRVEIVDFLPLLEAYLPVVEIEKGPDRDQFANNFVTSVFKFCNRNQD